MSAPSSASEFRCRPRSAPKTGRPLSYGVRAIMPSGKPKKNGKFRAQRPGAPDCDVKERGAAIRTSIVTASLALRRLTERFAAALPKEQQLAPLRSSPGERLRYRPVELRIRPRAAGWRSRMPSCMPRKLGLSALSRFDKSNVAPGPERPSVGRLLFTLSPGVHVSSRGVCARRPPYRQRL